MPQSISLVRRHHSRLRLERLEDRLQPSSLHGAVTPDVTTQTEQTSDTELAHEQAMESGMPWRRIQMIKRLSGSAHSDTMVHETSTPPVAMPSSADDMGMMHGAPAGWLTDDGVQPVPALRMDSPMRSQNFELVGHHGLFGRGMNAAPAIYDHYVYVGNRTDGSPGHPHPGVLVVDVANPAEPKVVGEIGPPLQGNKGETSRELRVWPEQKLLMVMNFDCSATIHACQTTSIVDTIKFYDLTGENAAAPTLVSTYTPSRMPHEMFLWVDPKDPARALLYQSTPTSSLTLPNLIVTDISRAREGIFTEVVKTNWNDEFRPQFRQQNDVRLHSIGVSVNGTRIYLAYLGGGFAIVDSSDLANNVPNPELRLVTPIGPHPHWGDPGAHSAVKVFGRPLALVTDEVYGTSLGGDHGCPWGWVRMIDMTDEVHPQVVGEYKIEQNSAAFCETERGKDPQNTKWTSYSSHNPTVLKELAFVTWHSAGLQAFSIADPTNPVQTGFFIPEPLRRVATEDPALSLGYNKVVMWSYPIIKDGLIYVIDVRNGLYVLRYTGPGSDDVANIKFLEGNSNLGDALTLETP